MTQSGLTKTQRELQAVNQILESVGQAPVTSLNQSNPDVAIAHDTLEQVSRDVQAEGWTFNKEYHYALSRETDKTINVTDGMLQVTLCPADVSNKDKRAVVRTQNVGDTQRKLYDIINHTFEWPHTMVVDIIFFVEWVAIPIPVQTYIVSRAAKIYSQRTVGDGTQYTALQEQETTCRAYALEYETSQIERSMFVYDRDGSFYNSYQPFSALMR